MTTNNLDLNAMGLTSLNEAEMVEITGGGIFKWIGAAVGAVVGFVVGFVVGGVDGAILGATLGAFIGAGIDNDGSISRIDETHYQVNM